MKVVSNSSILIGLSAIGRLELLYRRFPEGIIVPDAVWREVVEAGHGRAGAEQVAGAEWIYRQQIQNNTQILQGPLLPEMMQECPPVSSFNVLDKLSRFAQC